MRTVTMEFNAKPKATATIKTNSAARTTIASRMSPKSAMATTIAAIVLMSHPNSATLVAATLKRTFDAKLAYVSRNQKFTIGGMTAGTGQMSQTPFGSLIVEDLVVIATLAVVGTIRPTARFFYFGWWEWTIVDDGILTRKDFFCTLFDLDLN